MAHPTIHRRTIAWTVATMLLGAGFAQAQAASSDATRPHPVLVELFTSEGCSSCPPADDLLKQLQREKTYDGQMIVVLSEHVTYWNHDGWADRFSRPEFDDRQSVYSGRFMLDNVYTPQAVVNGNREMLGSDGDAILAAIQAQPTTPVAKVHIVSLTPGAASGAASGASVSGRPMLLSFSVDSPVPAGAEVYAVVADDMDSTVVARGENAGRTLNHVAVARSMVRIAKLKSDQALAMTIALPGIVVGRSQHVVLFAQEAGQGRVLSLATAPVPMDFPQQAAQQTVGR